MIRLRCSLLLSVLVVGLVSANACGRTEMNVTSREGGQITGGASSGSIPAGATGGSTTAGSVGRTGGTSRSGTSSVGGTGGSGGSDGGVCSEAPCWASLTVGCLPSGGCTYQHTQTSVSGTLLETGTYCYSNGVKQQQTTTTTTSTMTAKRDNNICYSSELSLSTGSFVLRDGGGNQVATGTLSRDSHGTYTVVVTCNGGQPTRLSDACYNADAYAGTCLPGECTF